MAMHDIAMVSQYSQEIAEIRRQITAMEFALMPDKVGGNIDPNWLPDVRQVGSCYRTIERLAHEVYTHVQTNVR